MSPAEKQDKPTTSKPISSSEGIWFGLMLLSQVTGILIATTLGGLLVDMALHSSPIGLAGGILVGASLSTALAVTKAVKELRG